MSEEEKKAIDFINNVEYKEITSDEFYDNRDILLNLIVKQENEIDYLKDVKMYLVHSHISKDKIRELKQLIHNTLDENGITRGYQQIIDKYFDELLEENNND